MKREIVQNTRNGLLFREMVEQLRVMGPACGQFGFVEGPAGVGKTSFAKLFAEKFGAVYYSIAELETAHTLLGGIDKALNGFTSSEYGQRLWLSRLIEDLRRRHWPLILLDEADRLDRIRHGVCLLEVIRDVHDRGESPIILLSISHLARRLANPTGGYAEAFSSRVGARVRFEGAELIDAELLARSLIEDVRLDADLLQQCVSESGGSYRPLLRLFEQIERTAKSAGIRTVSLAKWRQLASFAGLPAGSEAPRRQNAKQSAKDAAA
jgi:DNA transposition AAA+ family ATPase